MRIMTKLSIVLLAAAAAACSKDSDKASTKVSAAAPAFDVEITPTGEAVVSFEDENGQPVPARGATGRIELADGDTVPLTPDGDGQIMTAPLGAHLGATGHGCMATVRVTMPDGVGRSKDVDLCREHARHGTPAGHPGEGGHGRGSMGPGMEGRHGGDN